MPLPLWPAPIALSVTVVAPKLKLAFVAVLETWMAVVSALVMLVPLVTVNEPPIVFVPLMPLSWMPRRAGRGDAAQADIERAALVVDRLADAADADQRDVERADREATPAAFILDADAVGVRGRDAEAGERVVLRQRDAGIAGAAGHLDDRSGCCRDRPG